MSGQSASAVADRSSPAIHLLVLPRVHLLDLAGPAQVFASEHLNCRLSYISPQSALRSSQGLSLCELQALPGEVAADSWLVVIGSSLMEQQLRSNELRSTIDWLHNAQHKYRRLAAVCSGSLLLGKAGLLDGVRCTTI